MSDNTFKFCFQPNETEYYTVSAGNVLVVPAKTYIESAVADWREAQVSFKRSSVYWSAFREFTVPLKFVLDAARILSHILTSQGYTARTIFRIEKLNRTTRQYEHWFSGDIDYTTSRVDENYFQAAIKELGLVGLIKNREDVVYEIPLTDPSAIPLRVGGVLLRSGAKWIPGDGSLASPPPGTDFVGFQSEVPTITFTGSQNSVYNFIDATSQNIAPYTNINFIPNLTPPLFKALNLMRDVNIKGKMRTDIHISGDGTLFRYKLYIGIFINGVATSYKVWESAQLAKNTWYTLSPLFDFTIPINIPEGANVYIFNSVDEDTSSGTTGRTVRTAHYTDGNYINLSYLASLAESNSKGFRYVDLFKRLISKITDGQYTGVSNFLSNTDTSPSARNANVDNSPYNTVSTSGDSLRGLPNAKIKTSLKDFFKDSWSRWMLCLSIEGNTVRLEPMSYFFNNENILHVSLLSNFTYGVAQDFIFNQIKIGYGSYDSSNIVGKNEFNTGLSFLLKDNISKEAIDENISKYRADVYGIEAIRAETFDQDKKDNKSDNDTFLVEVAPTPIGGFYLPYRTSASNISGVDDPSGMYNIALSPKRSLARHLPRIRSILRKGILQFQTTDKNPDLVSNMGAGVIVETANVDLSANTFLGKSVAPLFQPITFEFDCAPPYTLAEILALQTKGCISFDYNGYTFKGFILDVGCTPATNDKYNFKLLSHPDNDLSKLIR